MVALTSAEIPRLCNTLRPFQWIDGSAEYPKGMAWTTSLGASGNTARKDIWVSLECPFLITRLQILFMTFMVSVFHHNSWSGILCSLRKLK